MTKREQKDMAILKSALIEVTSTVYFERFAWGKNDFIVKRQFGRVIGSIKQDPDGYFYQVNGGGMGFVATLADACHIFKPGAEGNDLPTEIEVK